MVRRFQILLADAFFLVAIGVLAFTASRFFQSSEPTDPESLPVVATALAETPSDHASDVLPGLGQAMVSAWVQVKPGQQLIMPGDEVVLSVPSQDEQTLGPFRVAKINSAGNADEPQAFMSLTGDRDQIKRVRFARETELLQAEAYRARLPFEALDAPRLRNDQIITRRYRDTPWNRRVAAD